ncbi:MAG: hypothetical protein JSS49_00545 [Planctomycetes bacterium]|nr:hypothetical protein [Planctomycetota bacterium]
MNTTIASVRIPRWMLMAAFSVVLMGCERNARSLSVNEASARDACKTFLTAWKEGKKATDLAPKIIGKDSDWDAGRTLESFEILPQERSDGANLFLNVKRSIKTQKGAVLEQEVGYVVGTSPVITVFRSDQ